MSKHTRVALVCVLSEVVAALGDVQVLGGDDLVEGVGGAGELLAGVAVAMSMSVSCSLQNLDCSQFVSSRQHDAKLVMAARKLTRECVPAGPARAWQSTQCCRSGSVP